MSESDSTLKLRIELEILFITSLTTNLVEKYSINFTSLEQKIVKD